MKRGRFDNDYDRVRYVSGLARPPRTFEFPEEIEGYDRGVADRVEAMRLNFHDKMNLARAGEQERERVAGIAQRHIEHRAEVDRAIMLAEYAQHGLTPPEPLHSLKFMMTLGWHIEQYGDRNVLVRPERIMKKKDEPAAKAELNDDIPF